MPLSSRDIENIHSQPSKEPAFGNIFLAFFRLLSKIPFISDFFMETSGGIAGRIFRFQAHDKHHAAAELAIHALNKFRNKKSLFLKNMEHHDWWGFMKYGVESARTLDDNELREKYIDLANNGIEPYEGYDVAFSYNEFSRWKYDTDDYDAAFKYAEIASNADKTWAESEFLLGWYSLLLGRGNAEQHLSRAIEIDKRTLFRISNNEVCKQYPHIIKKLKAKYAELESAA